MDVWLSYQCLGARWRLGDQSPLFQGRCGAEILGSRIAETLTGDLK
jgi:hypothetical protein